MIKQRSRARYLGSKALRYGIAIWIILTINFCIPRVMPGDPVTNLLGDQASIPSNQDTINQLKAEYGLDRPLYVQYFDYLASLSRLDLGTSITRGQDVTDLVADRLFWTLLVVLPAIVAGSLLALVAGSIAGYKCGRKIDALLTGLFIVVYTTPGFLAAMIVVSIFSFHLGWFPLGNMVSGGTTGILYFFDVCYHLFLPVTILAVMGASYKFLVVRSAVIQTRGEYYVFVARAKGLSDRMIAIRHVMRNVLPQFISMVALNIGFMVSGSILLEIVFSLNGMGTLIYDAVMARDYPVIQGTFLVLTLFVILSNFLAEVLYGIADPRIADAKTGGAYNRGNELSRP
jgi:peptide/nickel transport system permease protein